MANEMRKGALTPEIAPPQEAEAKIGVELLCENFETGGSVVGKVVGKDKNHVRLRIDELNRDWLVRPARIDLAKGTWMHVAADYPAIAEDKEFDALYRPQNGAVPDPEQAGLLGKAKDELLRHLPPEARAIVEKAVHTAIGKGSAAPGGTVYARWIGHGKLDAPFLKAGTREEVRGAKTGDEGFFAKKTVEKFKERERQQGVAYFVEL